jgi:septum formation protein
MAAALPLILASASPRRRDLLARAGVPFEVHPADIPEEAHPGEAPVAYAQRLARAKALTVAGRVGRQPRRLVLGADTIVVIDGEVLGKPRDADDAVRLLTRLIGRRHRVVTAVALTATDTLAVHSAAVESDVVMRPADALDIATGESLDKAGAYAAQGEGRRFIERIEGSESNVIGLPLDETLALLRAAGLNGFAP